MADADSIRRVAVGSVRAPGRRRWSPSRRTERGAAAVAVLAGAVALAVVGAAGLGRAAAVTGSVARVQAVADLTASAGVVAGRTGAERVAGANGAAVRSFRVAGPVVTVEVAAAGVVRSASARPARSGDDTGAWSDGDG